eukprot:TRINITY_DN61026_c0_g1_i1.p1 TRINITY_DN61026_c0_g1~~TRINITY_DN61026_c0_g1_i1.p1  ORF type:complete len:521 (+),score=75.99 TRINITY_DN61026_c0_g1_i1:126-1688(+)
MSPTLMFRGSMVSQKDACRQVAPRSLKDNLAGATPKILYRPRAAWSSLVLAWRRYKELVVLAAVQIPLLADQQVLPMNLTAAARDFGFDEAARDARLGGDVAIVFFTAGALASTIGGRLSDVTSRIRLIALFGLIGGLGSCMNSVVTSFGMLLVSRALVGVAVGGTAPAAFSAMGDLFAAEERPKAVAAFSLVSGIGPGLGQALAGFMGAELGWRWPFRVTGAAAIVASLLTPWLINEPKRGVHDRSEPTDPEKVRVPNDSDVHAEREATALPLGSAAALRAVLSTPSVLLTLLQGATGCVPWAVISTFLPDYLAEEGGIGVPSAAFVLLLFGVGCGIGVSLGGWFGERLYAKDPRLQPVLMAVTTAGGMFPLLLILSLPAYRPIEASLVLQSRIYCGLAFFLGLQAPVTGVNARAVLLNAAAPRVRGMAFGIYAVMDDVGKGLGPLFVSLMERHVTRRHALSLGSLFWLPCSLFCGLMCLTYKADLEAAIRCGQMRALERVAAPDTIGLTRSEATVSHA